MSRNLRGALAAAIAAASILVLAGCGKSGPKAGNPAGGREAAKSNIRLRLLVVGDPPLAQKIGRLKGEWEARAGATLEVQEFTAADLAKAPRLAADAVVYPEGELGSLVERHLLLPLPAEWLARPEFQRADLLELVGQRETVWGEQTYAVPLGSPVLVCFYRPDLFERAGRHPPRTWAEYQELAAFFGNRENLKRDSLPADWSGTVEPLAPGWAGDTLLARAAAYAKHPDYYSTLFDKETMEPRIASEPFVRALNELIAAAKHAAKDQRNLTPAGVRQAFLAGHAAMALSWPTAADSAASSAASSAKTSSAPPEAQSPPIAFAELPGSAEVFSPRENRWQPRQPDDEADWHVPLLGVSGRLGSVVEGTTARAAAIQLLEWLSSDEWGSQISPASKATTLFRRSQVAVAARWMEPGIPFPAARQYGDVVARSLSRPQWLFAPRIPGRADYMAALDDAVRQAVAGEKSPSAALADAAQRWRGITTRLGLAAQRTAYLRGLGLEP